MRKLRLLGLCLLVAVTAFTFTSCLNSDDDNDNSMTPAEKAASFQIVQGSYSGKVYAIGRNVQNGNSEATDSADVAWSINTDSTMIFHMVPARFLALAIDTTTTEHKAIREAVMTQAPSEVKCGIAFYKYYQEWTTYPFWFINPGSVTYNVTVDGTSHKVVIGFWGNSTSSYGVYNTTTKAMSAEILLAGATIDDVTPTVSITNAVPLVFVKK
jgi:hypothetical protein